MRRMMITSAVFLAVLLPSVAQQVGNAPLREYMRPSLTAVYINRGEPLSERIIRQMIAKGVPGKFDDNSIEQNILTVDREQTLTPEAIRRTLESDVSREVIRRWFPAFDAERGGFTTAVLAERGLNDATDTDVTIARASNMGEEILKDRGMELIGRSYILVYDFRNTEQTGNGQDEGYRTDCDVYLYHLDWSEETKNAFYARFNSPDGIDESHFPVRHIASFVGESELTGISISQSARDNALRLSDEQLFAAFAAEIRKKADVYLTQASEDFQVKSEIYAVHPLRAKIGVKEGVTVDQRYFVYDIHENAAGEQTAVRKGVMRATSGIARNEGLATGDGPATTFYQTYGKRLRPGMLIRQQPDWGIGWSMLGGTDLQALVELSVVMWLAKYIPALDKLKFPSSTKIYLRYDLPFEPMQIDGIRADKNHSLGFLGIGLSKDFYFAHYFSITPYVGYQEMLVSEEEQEWIDEAARPASGYEAGLNMSIAILHNMQLTGSAGWSTVKANWFPQGLTTGGGIRIQF